MDERVSLLKASLVRGLVVSLCLAHVMAYALSSLVACDLLHRCWLLCMALLLLGPSYFWFPVRPAPPNRICQASTSESDYRWEVLLLAILAALDARMAARDSERFYHPRFVYLGLCYMSAILATLISFPKRCAQHNSGGFSGRWLRRSWIFGCFVNAPTFIFFDILYMLLDVFGTGVYSIDRGPLFCSGITFFALTVYLNNETRIWFERGSKPEEISAVSVLSQLLVSWQLINNLLYGTFSALGSIIPFSAAVLRLIFVQLELAQVPRARAPDVVPASSLLTALRGSMPARSFCANARKWSSSWKGRHAMACCSATLQFGYFTWTYRSCEAPMMQVQTHEEFADFLCISLPIASGAAIIVSGAAIVLSCCQCVPGDRLTVDRCFRLLFQCNGALLWFKVLLLSFQQSANVKGFTVCAPFALCIFESAMLMSVAAPRTYFTSAANPNKFWIGYVIILVGPKLLLNTFVVLSLLEMFQFAWINFYVRALLPSYYVFFFTMLANEVSLNLDCKMYEEDEFVPRERSPVAAQAMACWAIGSYAGNFLVNCLMPLEFLSPEMLLGLFSCPVNVCGVVVSLVLLVGALLVHWELSSLSTHPSYSGNGSSAMEAPVSSVHLQPLS